MTNETGDPVILATGGYDHTIKLWQAHIGVCTRTAPHTDSQVNALEITPDKQLIAAAGYQHIRLYDVTSSNPSPVLNYEGLSRNVTAVVKHHHLAVKSPVKASRNVNIATSSAALLARPPPAGTEDTTTAQNPGTPPENVHTWVKTSSDDSKLRHSLWFGMNC
ncbi:hypothetical protein J437_LFUL010339 [Ladona fulva]|uniref:Target of rapamycin complex subunit lst8 n=1 Tax=Ladona fulva TaxID=123851 RepID=A0A8K0JZX7_LADFU|nr:hypothetical protein J437_LFUL010339 [Ladona fulva]